MMKRRILSLILAGAMLAGLFACAPAQSQTAGGTDADSTQTQQTTPAAATAISLLDGLPVLYDTSLTPAVPTFTVEPDLSNVINADTTDFWSDEARQKLAENGFLVSSGGWEFYEQYESNRYAYTPNFVTTDALLHTYHL